MHARPLAIQPFSAEPAIMSPRHILIIVLGVALLLLNFVFPVVRYSFRTHQVRDGEVVRVRLRPKVSFAFPIWTVWEAARATRMTMGVDHAMIIWPYTIIRAVVILAVMGFALGRIRPATAVLPNPTGAGSS